MKKHTIPTKMTICAVIATICFFINGMISATFASDNIHSIWSELLGKHINNQSVDYIAFKQDEPRLDEYLDILDKTKPEDLPEKERLALYINGYNAYTVKLILNNFSDGRPESSIKNIGGFFSGPWKIKFCRIGGEIYSLDDIEHEIIRPQFKEPRVHFAVNCASKSCPPLISTAYTGELLDKQLEENTISFLNDTRFNYLEGTTLYASKIFKWFSEDFKDGTLAFFRQYARGSMKKNLDKQGEKISIKYLDYDWSLNEK